LRAGLMTLLCQQFIILSTFFVLPLYLQTVLGYDALQTGITILPLSIGLFVLALVGSSLTGRYSPKRLVEIGLFTMLIGEVLLIAYTDPDLRSLGFGVALALVGAGLGLLASQLGNVIMSSVSPERGSEVGGLQGTAQNLGGSLGTALIGSILIGSLVVNFQTQVLSEPALVGVQQELAAAAEANANFVSADQLQLAAEQAGLAPAQVDAVVHLYSDAQIAALRTALAGIAIFALVALWYVRNLPSRAVVQSAEGDAAVSADVGSEAEPVSTGS